MKCEIAKVVGNRDIQESRRLINDNLFPVWEKIHKKY